MNEWAVGSFLVAKHNLLLQISRLSVISQGARYRIEIPEGMDGN